MGQEMSGEFECGMRNFDPMQGAEEERGIRGQGLRRQTSAGK
jgi:hypothetical protein